MQIAEEKCDKSAVAYSRRQLLTFLLTGAAGTLAAACWGSVNTEVPLRILLPDNNSPDNPSFEVFFSLSQLITLRENLNTNVGKRIYELIITEPWGKQHISRAYAALQQQKPGTKLDEGLTWFVSHVLTTWYLGIYYHEDRLPQRVTYEYALMFDAVNDFYSAPMTTALGYGVWAQPVSKDTFKHE